tara:strand:- start:2151 stop:2462 length:312 start_codon:yes stop_codon:yes gene_type:complete
MADILSQIERTDESIVLTFKDNDVIEVPYHVLRSRCPCANCSLRWEDPHRRLAIEEEVKRLRVEMPKAEPVGRYAVRFVWTSGCSSGLWSFKHLTSIATGMLD